MRPVPQGRRPAGTCFRVGGTLTLAATQADPFRINLWSLSGVSPDVSGSASNFNPLLSTSWTIASPTGEGLTTCRDFTRVRRCTLAGYFRIV